MGLRLRLRRQALGVGQNDLAEALGTTAQQVQRYEQAENRIAAVTLIKAAERLNTSVAALVGEEVTAIAAATPRPPRPDVTALLANYRALSPELQTALLDLSRVILEKGVALDGVLQRASSRRPGEADNDTDAG